MAAENVTDSQVVSRVEQIRVVQELQCVGDAGELRREVDSPDHRCLSCLLQLRLSAQVLHGAFVGHSLSEHAEITGRVQGGAQAEIGADDGEALLVDLEGHRLYLVHWSPIVLKADIEFASRRKKRPIAIAVVIAGEKDQLAPDMD